jgi:hypothetical protein
MAAAAGRAPRSISASARYAETKGFRIIYIVVFLAATVLLAVIYQLG